MLILLRRDGHYTVYVKRIYKYIESRGLFEVVLIGSTKLPPSSVSFYRQAVTLVMTERRKTKRERGQECAVIAGSGRVEPK
jgi:hypothetical protein